MPGQAYTLDSVVLRLTFNDDTFGPRPLTAPILRLLNDQGNPIPGPTVLATFTNPPLVGGVDNFTFTPTAPFTLEAGKRYWLALNSAVGFGTSGLTWFGSSPTVNPTGVATFSGNSFTSNGGVTWVSSNTVKNSFAVNATLVVPEPSPLIMVAGGVLAVFGRRAALRRPA